MRAILLVGPHRRRATLSSVCPTYLRSAMYPKWIISINRLRINTKKFVCLARQGIFTQISKNAPVELPEVVAFPQWVVNQPQHKHLNIVYSTT